MPDDTADELIRRTRFLVDIPSVSGSEEELLESILESMPPFLRLAYRGDAVAVLTTPLRPGKELVVLAGHTDTVPITENLPSRIEGNDIVGRGTSDMKGGLAVMMEAAQWISDTQPELDFDIAWLFFGREELPSDFSALLPALRSSDTLRSASFAVLFEPTSNAVEAGCQGNLNLTLAYTGTAAHSARPWMGANAAHTAVRDLQELASMEPVDIEVEGLVFREVAGITGIRGGTARNVLPDRVEVDVNVRYSPIRNPEEVEAHWRKRYESEHVEMTIKGNAPPAPVMTQHPLARRLLNAGAGSPQPKQAWTNAADFASFGIPAINFGPGNASYAHRDDERISITDLVQGLEILQRFLQGSR